MTKVDITIDVEEFVEKIIEAKNIRSIFFLLDDLFHNLDKSDLDEIVKEDLHFSIHDDVTETMVPKLEYLAKQIRSKIGQF